jgi:hypothetical protein
MTWRHCSFPERYSHSVILKSLNSVRNVSQSSIDTPSEQILGEIIPWPTQLGLHQCNSGKPIRLLHHSSKSMRGHEGTNELLEASCE